MGTFTDHQPMFVEVETTTYCNRRCTYCPNSIFERGLRRNEVLMDQALFEKIVTDLGDNKFCMQFSPHRYGEPLADPRMPELLAIARKAMPLARIALYTNGDFLTPELFGRIDEYIDAYIITQHGDIMPPGVKKILESDDPRTAKIRYKTKEQIMNNASNRAGLIPISITQRKACGVVMNELHINAHGHLMLCCEDYLGQKVFGSIRDMTIEEAWSMTNRIEVHRANVAGDFALPQCKTCGYGRMS